MAYSIQQDAVIELRFRFVQAAQELMIIRHYRYSGTPTIADGRQAAQLLAEHTLNTAAGSGPGRFATHWQQMAAFIGVSLYAVDAQWVWPIRYGPVRVATVVAGVAAADPVPTGIAASIQLSGERAGRHYVGRMQIPGIAVTQVSINSTWTGPCMTKLTNLGVDMAKPIEITGPLLYGPWTPIVYQRQAPTSSGIVTTSFAHTQCRTMRRRVVGRGI